MILPAVYDLHIIPNLTTFLREHPVCWYVVICVTVVGLLDRNWCTVTSVKTTAYVRMTGVPSIKYSVGIYFLRSIRGQEDVTHFVFKEFDTIIIRQDISPTFWEERENNYQMSKYVCVFKNVSQKSFHNSTSVSLLLIVQCLR